MAPPPKRRKLLAETYAERRLWIVAEGPGMIETLKKFNVFVRCPEEVRFIFLLRCVIDAQ